MSLGPPYERCGTLCSSYPCTIAPRGLRVLDFEIPLRCRSACCLAPKPFLALGVSRALCRHQHAGYSCCRAIWNTLKALACAMVQLKVFTTIQVVRFPPAAGETFINSNTATTRAPPHRCWSAAGPRVQRKVQRLQAQGAPPQHLMVKSNGSSTRRSNVRFERKQRSRQRRRPPSPAPRMPPPMPIHAPTPPAPPPALTARFRRSRGPACLTSRYLTSLA